jgi:transcriptional regulator of stress and heat shock response
MYKIKLRSKKDKVDRGDVMTRLSDVIEEFIKELFEENRESELQIQRNELANYFKCAPSQINYVLTTRFTSDKGYYVESRRGGGGYIIIKRIEYGLKESLIEILNEKIGDNITYDRALQLIAGLIETDLINEREANIMKVVLNDRTLLEVNNRNKLRADLLKSMVMAILI